MRFDLPEKRPRAESIVPMINVVFLLLVFFLMTARIAPPDPFEVVLPAANEEAKADSEVALFISPEGRLAYRGFVGKEAFDAAVAQHAGQEPKPTLQLKADAGVEASEVAKLLAQLAQAGVAEITLLTVRR